MSFTTTKLTLASAVANGGTVTVPYPDGMSQSDFTDTNASDDGQVVVDHNLIYTEEDDDIGLSYGADDITLTNSTGLTWAEGSHLWVQLGQAGTDQPAFKPAPAIEDLASGSTVATTVTKVNEILSALRSKGLIES